MLDTHMWICPPQVKDLSPETEIGVTCRSCGARWGESVRALIEEHRMGADYIDLLEWKYRCRDAACGGLVRMDFGAEIVPEAEPVRVMTLGRPKKVERMSYPVKSVIQHRFYAPPQIPVAARHRQLALPL